MNNKKGQFTLISSLVLLYLVHARHIKHPHHHWLAPKVFHYNHHSNTHQQNSPCNKLDFSKSFNPESGYIDIKYENSTETKSQYFYVYLQNRYNEPELPLLLWSNGGPGCSSLEGMFIGPGPYRLQNDLSLCWSDDGWDQYHNILFVDHPLDVGFSYTLNDTLTINNIQTIGDDMLQFLYSFFEIHPELLDNDFYLTGVSFAGNKLN